MAFGKEIKRLRDESSVSAQKLADFIGLKVERLRKWEQRDLSPRDEDATLIERFFEMSLDEVMKLDSIKPFLKVPSRHITEPGRPGNAPGHAADLIQSQKDMIELLKEKLTYETNYQREKEATIMIQAYVKTIFQFQAVLRAKVEKMRVEDVEVEMHKALDENVQYILKEDK